MIFDANPANAATAFEAIVLVGVTGIAAFGSAAGLITFS